MIKTKWRDKWKFTAYEYPPDICKWFSVAVAKEVKAIRAGLKYRNDIKKLYQPFRKDDDAMKGFYRAAQFHVINEASLRDLDLRVRNAHPKGLQNYIGQTHDMWRPNIVIDTGIAYSEDYF